MRILLIIFIISSLISCELIDNNEARDLKKTGLTDGFCIQFNDDYIINHNEIEYYDSSSHLIYLKNADSILDQFENGGNFSIYANYVKIYEGKIQPIYSSYLPFGPIIYSFFSSYNNNIISIEYRNYPVNDSINNKSDPRNDIQIIEALKKHNQLLNGLSLTIDSLNYFKNQAFIKYTVKNNDPLNYYIFDQNKMGINLFHYFTNGLVLSGPKGYYYQNLEVIKPDPYNSWHIEWMMLLKSNEFASFIIEYNKFDIVPRGNYTAKFTFPGLGRQIQKSDITQENGRIWLGNITSVTNIDISD